MAKGDDIEERLITFAVRVLNVCESLVAQSNGAKHVRGQLVISSSIQTAKTKGSI